MNGRIHIAPTGAKFSPPLGELENGDLVVPENDGIRIWPLIGTGTINWTTHE